jgi:ditrans,polycis-polyprenyl diphosphate synthase
VTAYAFSIENFKRPQDEVNRLLSLAEEMLSELAQNG